MPCFFKFVSWMRTAIVGSTLFILLGLAAAMQRGQGLFDIDFTGGTMLCRLIAFLRERGIDVAMARLSAEPARRQAERLGVLAALGPHHVFRSVEDAIRALRLPS